MSTRCPGLPGRRRPGRGGPLPAPGSTESATRPITRLVRASSCSAPRASAASRLRSQLGHRPVRVAAPGQRRAAHPVEQRELGRHATERARLGRARRPRSRAPAPAPRPAAGTRPGGPRPPGPRPGCRWPGTRGRPRRGGRAPGRRPRARRPPGPAWPTSRPPRSGSRRPATPGPPRSSSSTRLVEVPLVDQDLADVVLLEGRLDRIAGPAVDGQATLVVLQGAVPVAPPVGGHARGG